MDPQPATFTVIVVAFHRDKEETVRSLGAMFAISPEDAAKLMERAPIRVKRGISAPETKRIAAKLRGIGADIVLRNELTSAEKKYPADPTPENDGPPSILRPEGPPGPAEADAEPVSTEAPPSVLRPEPRLSTVRPEPRPSTVRPEARPSTVRPEARPSTVRPEARPSTVRPEARPSTVRPEPRPRAEKPAPPSTDGPPSTLRPQGQPRREKPAPAPLRTEEAAPAPVRTEEAAPAPLPPVPLPTASAVDAEVEVEVEVVANVEASPLIAPEPSVESPPVPPEAGDAEEPAEPEAPRASKPSIAPFAEFAPPPAAVKAAALGKCAACARFVEKGGKCNLCGLSSDSKKRFCRVCGKDVALTPGLPRTAWIASIGGSVVAGIALSVLFRIPTGVSVAALVAGVAFVLDGARQSYRCVGCRRSAEARWLLPAEKQRFAGKRVQRIGAGALSLALSAGALGVTTSTTGGKPMVIDAFGVSYRASLPKTHANSEPVLSSFDLPADLGSAQLFTLVSTDRRRTIHTYVLAKIGPPRGTPRAVDDAGIDRLMQEVVEKFVPGATLGGSAPLHLKDAPGRAATFDGKVGNASASGRVRAYLFERYQDIVVVLYVSSSPNGIKDANGAAYLDSFAPEQLSD